MFKSDDWERIIKNIWKKDMVSRTLKAPTTKTPLLLQEVFQRLHSFLDKEVSTVEPFSSTVNPTQHKKIKQTHTKEETKLIQ